VSLAREVVEWQREVATKKNAAFTAMMGIPMAQALPTAAPISSPRGM